MDITEVGRRTRELVCGVEGGVGQALDRAEEKVAQVASRSQPDVDAAFARAQQATAKLADLSAVPLMHGIARKELPKAAEVLHQEYKNGGVQQVAADSRHVMHEVNVGAAHVVKPIVGQLLTPARESGKATAAARRGDWSAAAEHQVTAVVADARTLMPAQVAALEAGQAAREQGKGATGVVAAASKAGNRVGLDVVNGMNPLYLFPVAGEDGHQAVRKLLLDRDLQGFGRESMTGLLHGVQATTSAMGLGEAAVLPVELGLGADVPATASALGVADAAPARLGATTTEGVRSRMYRPTTAYDARLPAGGGETDKFGNVTLSPHGTATDRTLALAHEEVHSALSPKAMNALRTFRADVAMAGYGKSALLKGLEEAMAETVAQVSVRGLSPEAVLDGIRFPVTNGYVTLSRLTAEASVATIAYAGTLYGVYVTAEKLGGK